MRGTQRAALTGLNFYGNLSDRMVQILSASGTGYADIFGSMLGQLIEIGWMERKVGCYLLNPIDPAMWSPLPNLLGEWGAGTWHGDPIFVPGQGTAGDGVGAYLTIPMSMAQIRTQGRAMGFAFTDQEFTSSFYVQSDTTAAAFDAGWSGAGSVGWDIRFRSTASCTVNVCGSGTLSFGGISTSRGLSTISRVDATNVWFAKNGTITNKIQALGADPSGGFGLFRVGIASQYSAQEVMLMAFGAPCDPAIEVQAYNIIRNALAIYGTLVPDLPPISISPPHTFGPGAQALVQPNTIINVQIAAPPTSAQLSPGPNQTYAGFPISHCAFKVSATARPNPLNLPSGEYLPMDRCQGPPGIGKGSWSGPGGGLLASDGQTCVFFYTSVQRAMAVTLIKTAYSNGLLPFNDPDHPQHYGWLDIAQQWWPGIDISVWQSRWAANPSDLIFTKDQNVDTGTISHNAYWSAHVDTLFTNQGSGLRYAVDGIALNPGRLCDELQPYFFLFDGERFDILDEASQLLFNQFSPALADIIHCKRGPDSNPRRYMITGPGPGQGLSGARCGFTPDNGNTLTTGAHAIDNMFIGIHEPPPAGGNEAYLLQQFQGFQGPDGTLPLPAGVVGVQYPVGGPQESQATPAADTALCRSFLTTYNLTGYLVVPGGGLRGGAPSRNVNLNLATLNGLPQNQFVGY